VKPFGWLVLALGVVGLAGVGLWAQQRAYRVTPTDVLLTRLRAISAGSGDAQAPQARLETRLEEVYAKVRYVSALRLLCDSVSSPPRRAARDAAVSAWQTTNARMIRLTEPGPLYGPASGLRKFITKTTLVEVSTLAQTAAGHQARFCGDVPALLSDPQMQLEERYGSDYARFVQIKAGKPVPGVPKSQPQGSMKKQRIGERQADTSGSRHSNLFAVSPARQATR
jgi:hypothetical protein